MDLETSQTNTTAKLPLLKRGEYDMWKLRIEQYFQIQDYFTGCLITANEKTQKKNDVKERSMLLMALPNEHLLTFNQYKDAKTLFAAIQTRFGGNDATKKTQKTLLKQMYENFKDLNLKFLRSLPSEWNTHVVVWRNKPDLDTMSFDDLYNNFKIVEQEVKGTASSSSSSSSQNLAFVSSTSSTNEVNTAYGVSTANTQVSTASTQVSTANLSDDTVYAFLASQPNGSHLVHEDLEQIHEDDLEEMDLKWQLALLSMRTRKFFQKTGRKITINGSDTAGYDKSKVECFNCHKLGHFARECRGPRNQDNRSRNQDSSRRTINVEEISSKSMLAIDGAGFDWSFMADEEVPTDMALMAFSDSEQLAVLKRDISYKDSEISVLKSELEKLKQEKESNQLKIENFDNAFKSLDKLIGSQIPDKSRKGLGFVSYNAVPPPPIGLFSPPNLDLSNSDLEKFQQFEFEGYGPKTSKSISEDTSNVVRESPDASLVEELELNDKLEKKTVFLTVAKINFIRPQQQEKLVRKPVKYAEMYRSQTPRANCNYHQTERMLSGNNYTRVNYNYFAKKAHLSAHRNIVPRAVLMKTGLRPLNTARPNSAVVNAVRANQGHPQKQDQGYVDSGCSRHMTGNMYYLSDFKEFDRGYVAFGGGTKGGRITGKGTLKTGKLDFEDLADKSQVLLKVPRKNNMYSVDMKNSVPKESLTCLVAKATLDESMLWHRRLGYVNFKTINKLIKDNLKMTKLVLLALRENNTKPH
ncbi:ribonuclease H-like domain-containing protein, partial [Tanacetum coccineum]